MLKSLDSLRYFIAVVKLGSFSAAAEKLDTSVSSISRHVQLLEKELQVPLLIRHTRRLSLTETGKLVFEQGQEVCTQLDTLGESIVLRHQQVRGTVRISAPYGLDPTRSLLC
ncbi:LysR family transcriptional regulator [Dongshaea marina]|uniref:LysR family transcriptional regulator n=1 Tax=Dongshaea marina TaxID=2047966 RepID=UPI000D3E493B|nr:LysR family transcriptional regulator [Dongshaea marina]